LDNKFSSLPEHIGFIMDGNGRWAKKRLMPRTYGHNQGVKNVIEIVEYAFNLGIKTVSLYAFSTENWSRPKDEVDTLFELIRKYFKDNINKLLKEGVRLQIMGDISLLPEDILNDFNNSLEKTKNNDKHILNIGINYGGRTEIVNAVNKIIKEGVKSVDEEIFKKYLDTSNLRDPDLIIRTSGESRLSNFLLYQAAYSELYFVKTLWPDFHKKELDIALKNYEKRNRRYGGV
jgi:undecaprenyl diphosphate synthase